MPTERYRESLSFVVTYNDGRPSDVVYSLLIAEARLSVMNVQSVQPRVTVFTGSWDADTRRIVCIRELGPAWLGIHARRTAPKLTLA